MQVAVENFVSERLQQALSYRAMSKSHLAKACSISPTTITKYLNGGKPAESNFQKIAEVTKFPQNFFLQPYERTQRKPRLWRSLVSAKQKGRKMADAVIDWQIDLHERYCKEFDLPAYSLSHLESTASYQDLSYEDIDDLALALREHWGVGLAPMTQMIRAIERSGVVVTRVDLKTEKLDAVSTWNAEVPFIVLNSHKNSCARSRFDVAHELGHLLLHKSVTEDDYKTDFHEIESQAHYFASSLLLPEESFLSDVWAPTLKCFESIKMKWKVSIQAMIRRSLSLKAITQSQYSYLNIGISKKKWRTVEPYDDSLPVEKTRLFSQCLERIEDSKPRMEEFFALNLPQPVLEEMMELPKGYFGDEDAEESNIITFKRPC